MRLNFGCGGNHLDGWQNMDMEVDIRNPLPFPDDHADAIFIEHCLEHTTPQQAFGFMEEAYRILKPKGYFRVTVPSIVQTLNKITPEYLELASKFGAEPTIKGAIKSLIFNHGHESVWDYDILETYLWAVGFNDFRNISRAKLYESPFGCLEGHQKVIGKEYNDIESISVEAYK